MKTYIKKPEKVELYKMDIGEVTPKGVFDDMENGICGWVDGLLETLGCEGTPDILSGALCSIFDSLGTSFGCGELDPGECDVNADCEPFQECVGGLCVTPSEVCFYSENCAGVNQVCQDLKCCLPIAENCTTTAECCSGLACLEVSQASTENKLVMNGSLKSCQPGILI